MNKSKDGSKVALGMIKGKGFNTSVPSISIRFTANAEEVEELYQSEDESADKFDNENSNVGASDSDSSPLRYLPRLGKRSSSVDASLTSQDSSPPTDRWKFFSEIKGKITKGVEEIKHRNQEVDYSFKKTKDRDNSSLSDSDDVSESSISKTCGVVSTTEGVEMSSDDETPSIEENQSVHRLKGSAQNNKKPQRYKIIRKLKPFKEGKISIDKLADLYEIATGTKPYLSVNEDCISRDRIEVESGVEAMEDVNPQKQTIDSELRGSEIVNDEDMVSDLVDNIENVKFDTDNMINLISISGEMIASSELNEKMCRTYLAPKGFVDLRSIACCESYFEKFFRYIIIFVAIAVLQYYTLIPSHVTSFVLGVFFAYSLTYFFENSIDRVASVSSFTESNEKPVIEIPAVKEYRPIIKIEGWMNEYPEVYSPDTYHISRTQSVYIKLQGNLLRISHTKYKIPKRAVWSELEHKHIFTNHRVYSLLGANVNLEPRGLNNRRRWSKKYPICITFNSELNSSYNFEFDTSIKGNKDVESDTSVKRQKQSANKRINIETQIFSKLTDEEVCDLDDVSMEESVEITHDQLAKLSSGLPTRLHILSFILFRNVASVLSFRDISLIAVFVFQEDLHGTQIYLFGRTDREKEEWFRNFIIASHRASDINESTDLYSQISNNVGCNSVHYEQEYEKFMNQFQKISKQLNVVNDTDHRTNGLLWVNSILGRILFDFTHNDTFTEKVQERVQRKLSSIKLPQFVEQLSVSELCLGNSPPLIQAVRDPKVDHRGLWVDIDLHYEGNVSLKLQTKLNLMKLKHNDSIGNVSYQGGATQEKWECSDVDDTAESSSDEEVYSPTSSRKNLDGKANSSNSKKFMKMMDKITESKIFQAATENRYIKRAMEGVSNTDLYLKVELKSLTGTLVINLPPPPSDRMWIGFRPLPKLLISAQPTVGDRDISFLRHLSNWIEKKLTLEFQKVLVVPNMEDVIIPVMISKLPT
ncbi:hypothetical protein FQR65_LT12081 [Abscondita terminalis]|nr:hypothetical protein FQR65_LT12081 [Abscondita terminalis]